MLITMILVEVQTMIIKQIVIQEVMEKGVVHLAKKQVMEILAAVQLAIKKMKRGLNMALIKCSECGKEISDKADVCMNCGNPIQKAIKQEKLKQRKSFESLTKEEKNNYLIL